MTANRSDIPQFSYKIGRLPGVRAQCIGGSDRPWCALAACLSDAQYGAAGGLARHLTKDQQVAACLRGMAAYDVPPDRAAMWAAAQTVPWVAKLDPVIGHITLDLYQIDAINRLTIAGGVMALSCGLGKTPTALVAARAVGTGKRLWICCPINAFPTWRRWVPYLHNHHPEVRIISIDSLHKAHPANDGGVIIFDEAHLLGVAKTKRTQEAHRLRRCFDYGFCLTGTLLHGGIEKTLSIRDLAVPGLAQFANRWEAGEYFNCLVRKELGGRKVTSLARPAGPNKEAFFQWLSWGCVSLNRHSDEVRQSVKVPEQTLHRVVLGEPWLALHEIAAELALSILEDTGELPDAAKVAHLLCRFGTETKIAWLLEAMADNEEPVVVCAEYTESLDAIETALVENEIPYVRVDGAVTGKARAEAQRQFQEGEVRVFLGQMDAATVSLDLDRACISVGFDHTWKAANYDQFLGRTVRRTQKRECHHFDLVANALQDKVVTRIREQMDFDASLVEWQDLKRQLDMLKATV